MGEEGGSTTLATFGKGRRGEEREVTRWFHNLSHMWEGRSGEGGSTTLATCGRGGVERVVPQA